YRALHKIAIRWALMTFHAEYQSCSKGRIPMPKTIQMVRVILQSANMAALALLIAGAAHAQERSGPRSSLGCTTADFSGTYGYSGSGTILEGPSAGPVAFVGQLTADGKGSFAGG